MADLLAKFQLIDEMSEKLANIAECGQSMLNQIEQAGDAASAAFDGMSGTAVTTVTSVDGIATSISEMQDAAGNAFGSAESLTSAMDSFCAAAEQAASQAGYWTDAVGNYDKGALEATYSLEELVEAGFKSADALEEQNNMLALCERETDRLSIAMESASDIQSELSKAIEESSSIAEKAADSEKISTEANEALEQASTAAAEAMQELAAAQEAAESAAENCNAVMNSGTASLEEMEAAAGQACEAAEKLAVANEKADAATEELAKASQEASEGMEESGKKGVDAFEAISSALATAGITKTLKEMAEAAYGLVNAFSESEQIVVNATGSTGDTLAGLESSMMDAFSGNHQSLDTVAGAIGEINTRMGLTGETLTDVTDQFLDYATITGSDVVGSVQNVTKVMNKWGVEAADLESVLDKLSYAGQISGASVDDLSGTLISGAASFQSMGLSLDNAISMLSDFELAGISSSSAVTAIRTAVNNFAEDGIDAQTGLQSVITEMQNMESTSDATALAVETFGSRAGQELALAIQNGTLSIDTFTATLDEAEGTLQSTAEAGETLSQKWQESTNKIKSAFTEALEPSLEKISSSLADATGQIGDFLDEHPAVTAGITGVATALGIAAAGVAAVTFATKVAIPAIISFGTAIDTAMGPVGWIAIGLTAVVGGVAAVTAALSTGEEEIEDYNGTLAECADEISRTEAAYEKACEMYGANSDAAQELEDQLETLNAQYEKGGGEISQYAEQAEELASSFDDLSEAQKSAMDEVNRVETSGLTAIAMLSSLANQSNLTNADLDMMASYADYLNQEFNCDINVNYNTGELTGFDPEEIVNTVIKAADNDRYQSAIDYLSGAEFQDGYIDAKQHVIELQNELDALYDELSQKENLTTLDSPEYAASLRGTDEIRSDIGSVQASLESYQDTLRSAESDINSYGLIIDDTGEFTENYKDMLDELAVSTENQTDVLSNYGETTEEVNQYMQDITDGQEVARTVMEGYTDQILELCQAYDDAYNAAYESFSGQFGLFDEASTESETYMNATVTNAQAALDSQLAYWEGYSANISVLKNTSAEDLGITQENYDALMSYVQSGSEEAAGLAASMVSELEHGHTDSVAELANTIGEVDMAQQEAAQMTAEWQTGLDAEMQETITAMQSAVQELDLSDVAQSSANRTMSGYINGISTSRSSAVSAAQSVVSAVQSVFNSANLSYSIDDASGSVTVAGHANGTTNAEDIFIAGEEGPELIVGHQGSTVFPTSETEKIMHAMDSIQPEMFPEIGDQITNYDESIHYGENRIFRSSPVYDTVYDNSNTVTYANTVASSVPNDITSIVFPSLELLSTLLEKVSEINLGYDDAEIETTVENIGISETENAKFYEDENAKEYETAPLYVQETDAPAPLAETDRSSSESTKRIVLEIDGSGSIDISGGITEEEVLELLQDHMKPYLMKIIRTEIYEEGDLSYEF